MEVHLNSDLQAKVDQWTAETGRPADDLIQHAMTGYFDELMCMRSMLDQRYDDIESGRVQLIDGEEAFARLLKKNEGRGQNGA